MKKELTALGIIVCAALLIWLCFSALFEFLMFPKSCRRRLACVHFLCYTGIRRR